MIVDLQQQAEPISLLHDLSVVKLRGVSCQCALERHCNMGGQSTEHFDVFGGKLLPRQLWSRHNSVLFLGGGHWEQVSASSGTLGCKGSQIRMFQHFPCQVRNENWLLFVQRLRHRTDTQTFGANLDGRRVRVSIKFEGIQIFAVIAQQGRVRHRAIWKCWTEHLAGFAGRLLPSADRLGHWTHPAAFDIDLR